MKRTDFSALLTKGPVILDGATGTNLARAGMPRGVSTEAWVLEHPEPLAELQRAYVAAGSQIVYAPTFGANRVTLGLYGLSERVGELNRRLVAVSREAVGESALIAGDMTTTGQAPEPQGPMTYETLLDVYREQAEALLEAGVDLFVAETLMGVTELQAVLEAVRALCDLPVLCSLSLASDGMAYFDGGAEDAAAAAEVLGADAVGVNCSVGPDQLVSVVTMLRGATSLPILAKPNAGLPTITDGGEAVYSMRPRRFAESMLRLRGAGASLLGGCCGTTPEYIRELVRLCGTK